MSETKKHTIKQNPGSNSFVKKERIYFIFSMDTEEDQWSTYSEKASVRNIEGLSEVFHILCQKYNIRPTYLVDTPVVEIVSSQNIIRELANANDCEIGMHLHPWRTKPHLQNYQFPKHTYIANYASDIIGEKIKKLFHEIQHITQQPCRTFRAGRWSMSNDAMGHLYKLGVNIDTSVTPYTSWEIYGGSNYLKKTLKHYKFVVPNFLEPDQNGNAYQIPPSIGWTRGNSKLMSSVEKITTSFPKFLKVKGVLHHLNLVRKVWVSPEQTSTKNMVMLCKNLIKEKQCYIHAMMHSTSLLPGASPYCRNKKDLIALYARIEELFQYVQAEQLKAVTLSEFVDDYYLED